MTHLWIRERRAYYLIIKYYYLREGLYYCNVRDYIGFGKVALDAVEPTVDTVIAITVITMCCDNEVSSIICASVHPSIHAQQAGSVLLRTLSGRQRTASINFTTTHIYMLWWWVLIIPPSTRPFFLEKFLSIPDYYLVLTKIYHGTDVQIKQHNCCSASL